MSEISCDEVLVEIEHFLHGELDANSAATLARHLAECEPCLDRAEFTRTLKMVIRTKCRSEAPPHLTVRIQEALRRESFH
ncbi:MAG: zf-HC2 domain-containing protein [Actinomycetota bacterium]|nr:zf-HC2 domain-containing protein [Actinomycetota bacterium]